LKIYKCIGNSSVSLSPILSKNEKVEYHRKINAHKLIVLSFCEWCQSLMWIGLILIPLSKDPTKYMQISVYKFTSWFC